MAAIATLTELPFVQIPFELDDDDLRVLSRLDNVEALGFRTRGLTDAGIASILKLQKVNDLTIDFGSPDDVPVEAIAQLSKLPSLGRLSTARLPANTIARIKTALPHVNLVIDALPDTDGPKARSQ